MASLQSEQREVQYPFDFKELSDYPEAKYRHIDEEQANDNLILVFCYIPGGFHAVLHVNLITGLAARRRFSRLQQSAKSREKRTVTHHCAG